jgi:hypothetical protein
VLTWSQQLWQTPSLKLCQSCVGTPEVHCGVDMIFVAFCRAECTPEYA